MDRIVITHSKTSSTEEEDCFDFENEEEFDRFQKHQDKKKLQDKRRKSASY